MYKIDEYKVNYEFPEISFPGFNQYLKDLYKNSINKYMNSVAKESNSTEQQRDIQKIKSFVRATEDYVLELCRSGFINIHNMQNIVTTIKKIKAITPLSKNERGIYGITNQADNTIEINPTLNDFRTQIYVGHELGHYLHDCWIEDVITYLQSLDKNPNIADLIKSNPGMARQLIYDGFRLLDEATVQETAEMVAYQKYYKKRPELAYHSNYRIFSGEPYKTNFDYYGELHEPAILFGRTLQGIGKTPQTPDEKIMKELAKKSFSSDFATSIIEEYRENPELEKDFITTMVQLGRIKDASYGLFGHGRYSNSQSLSKKCLDNTKALSHKNEDYLPKVQKCKRGDNYL